MHRPSSDVARLATAFALVTIVAATSSAASWDLLPGGGHHVDLSVTDDTLDILTTGPDPYVVGRWRGRREADQRVLEFEYFCSDGIDSLHAYFGPPIREANRIELPPLASSQGWHTYTADLNSILGRPLPAKANLLRLDFGQQADVRLQLRNVRLRSRSKHEREAAAARMARRREKRDQAARIERYLAGSYERQLDVRIDQDSVIVSLRGFDSSGGRGQPSAWKIIEYRPEHSIGTDTRGQRCDVSWQDDAQRQTFQVPRFEGGYDRLHSGWQIQDADSDLDLTARHFATRIKPESGDHARTRKQPRSQKGLSGFSRRGPADDLTQLGIHAVTINLVLTRFVSTTPGPDKRQIDVEGEPVFFNPAAFASYDRLLEFARRHEIVVSAIVLIPRGKGRPTRSPLVHPEADGGVYTMPDLSSSRGVRIYQYVLDAIARRYRGAERSPGVITNWIAHNEVDYHPMWTNMGDQPRPLFTETYYRSMRMIHNAAVAHNPHARVFVSLTHHWTVADDEDWQRLAPRDVLLTLQRYSQLEGDFAWGVAYHPYPQSLFAEVAWNDTQICNDFDTPLITFGNLQVLGEFMHQPSMRDASGAVRGVLLSEQGFHTEGYEPRSQALQAGSLSYAMNKVRSLPFIESFHYHRWIDHPDEGGLLLGLRTLPTAEHPHGERKLAWYVYQAIGTDRESAVTAGLPRP